MAGLRGNEAYWMIQKQTGIGVAATPSPATTIKVPFSAGAMGPAREIGTLAETDASRDQGIAYVKKSSLKGNPETYVRDVSIVPLLTGVLGADVVTTQAAPTGTTAAGSPTVTAVSSFTNVFVGAEIGNLSTKKTIPAGTTILSFNEGAKTIEMSANATGVQTAEAVEIGAQHTINPQSIQPYYTVWTMLGNTLFERHKDCIISDLEIKATAGSPLTAQATILGRETLREVADPGSAVAMQKGTVYNFNNGIIKLGGGGATALVASMTLGVQNNAVEQQTDNVVPIDVASGKRTVNCTFDLIFENLEEYNKFNYGSAAGTTVSSSIYTTSLNFKYELDANHSIEFSIPKFAYEEFPVAPEVQGAPLVVAVKGVAQRETNVITAVVKTGQRSY